MGIRIDDRVLEQVTKCDKRLACLSDSSHVLCEVRYFVGDRALFVECATDGFCAYQIPFGSGCLCRCPARKEIYRRYRV